MLNPEISQEPVIDTRALLMREFERSAASTLPDSWQLAVRTESYKALPTLATVGGDRPRAASMRTTKEHKSKAGTKHAAAAPAAAADHKDAKKGGCSVQ